MKTQTNPLTSFILLSILSGSAIAGLEPGEQINLTLRGVNTTEQAEISGIYRVGESGMVRLPMLKELVKASGLTPEEFARAVEEAYIEAGIYTRPRLKWKPCRVPINRAKLLSQSAARCVARGMPLSARE